MNNKMEYIKGYRFDGYTLQYESKKDIKKAFLSGVLNDTSIYYECESNFSSINIVTLGDEYVHGFYNYVNSKGENVASFFKVKLYSCKARFGDSPDDIEFYFKQHGNRYYINDFMLRGTVGDFLNDKPVKTA